MQRFAASCEFSILVIVLVGKPNRCVETFNCIIAALNNQAATSSLHEATLHAHNTVLISNTESISKAFFAEKQINRITYYNSTT